MKEIRFHGRGGQGVAVSVQMLVAAFGSEGKYAGGLPSFGVERRGAPVTAFVRVDDKPIREKTRVYFPDCLVLFDASQMKSPDTFAGFRAGGILVLNAPAIPHEKVRDDIKTIAVVDATRIAIEELGGPAVNSCMLGAVAAATGWFRMESVLAALRDYFEGELLRKNLRSAERGFRETKIKQ